MKLTGRSIFWIGFGLTLGIWLGGAGLLIWRATQAGLPVLNVRFTDWWAAGWAGFGGLLWIIALAGLAWQGLRTQQDARFDQLVPHLNDAIIVCDLQGSIHWRNPAADRMGIEGQQLPPALKDILNRRLAPQRISKVSVNLSGGQRYSVQAVSLPDSQVALICRSMPGLETQTNFYENFIHRIVHDMRNPLAGIIAHAANLRQSTAIEEEAWRKSAATIEREAQRVARLADSLLFDARLAHMPLEIQRLDLGDVLEDAIFSQDERAARENKQIALDTPPPPLMIEGDRDLLLRAFENIIDNSLKYSNGGAHLDINLQILDEGYLLSFADTGEGIPPAYLPDKIFEPLVRGHSQSSGSGLGLSITKKIIEMHAGSIEARSQVGQGTTMIIRLPAKIPARS